MGRFFDKDTLEGIKERNSKKFYEDQYTIASTNYNFDDKNLAIMSDIHYHPRVDKDLYMLLIEYARRTEPDFIIMPGDMIETNSFIDIGRERDFFEWFIRSLSEICPVVMIPGNHEIHNLEVKTFFSKSSSKESIKGMNFLESLTKFKDIYFLNNTELNLDGINFLGFSPSIETYLKRDERTMDLWKEEYAKANFKVNPDKYNVLLIHNSFPLTAIADSGDINDLNNYDLTISGHWHDGYLFKWLDRFIRNPYLGLSGYPKIRLNSGIIYRGIQSFGRGYLFTSQGVRTWNADIALFNLFEKICANDVERLTLTRKLKSN